MRANWWASPKFAVVMSSAIDSIGTLIFIKIITSTLPKSDAGIYFLCASVCALFWAISTSALDQGFLRNIATYERLEVVGVQFSSLLTIYSSIALLFIPFIYAAWKYAIGSSVSIFLFLFLWVLLDIFKNAYYSLMAGLLRRWNIVLAKTLEHATKLGACSFGIYLAPHQFQAVVVSILTASVVAALFSAFISREFLVKISSSSLKKTMGDVWQFSWPMVIWGGFGWMQNMSTRWVVGQKLNAEDVADYSVISSLAGFPIAASLAMVTAYVVPIIYRQSSRIETVKYVYRASTLFLAYCAILCCFVYLLSSDVVSLLASEKYLSVAKYVPVLMMFAAVSSSASILAYVNFASKRMMRLILPSVVPGIIVLIAAYFLVDSYGLKGAVAASCMGSITSAALYFIVFKGEQRFMRHVTPKF